MREFAGRTVLVVNRSASKWRETKARVGPIELAARAWDDFLGFGVRRYGAKPLIKPSKAAVRRIGERLLATGV